VPANGGVTVNTITTLDFEDTEARGTAVAMANTSEMAAVETMTRENAGDSLSVGKSDLPKYVTTTANGFSSLQRPEESALVYLRTDAADLR